MSQKALILEDTPANLHFFERLLTQAGFETISAETGHQALEKVADEPTLDLAVLDMEIPDGTGVEIAEVLRHRYPKACIVVATMHDSRSMMQDAFDKGCDIFLVKPYGFMELFKRLTTDGCQVLQENRPLIIDQYGPRAFQPAIS